MHNGGRGRPLNSVVRHHVAAANVEIANDFFHDAGDLLKRYRLTVEHFDAIKSRRMKLFLDLRMAAECMLKAYAAYSLLEGVDRKDAIAKVEAYGHNIGKMASDVKVIVDPERWSAFSPFVEQPAQLPVGLRYSLDGADFREVHEEFYYETVGSDTWLDSLHDVVRDLADALGARLATHSRIVSAAEIWEEMKTPRHNKYE